MQLKFTNATASKRYISAFNVALDPAAFVTTSIDQARLDREHQLRKDIELGLLTVAFVSVDPGDSVKTFMSSAGPAYTTILRPLPTTVPLFTSIWNLTTNIANWSDGTNWRDAAGAIV